MNPNNLVFIILLFLASCTASLKDDCKEAFFCSIEKELDSLGVLSASSKRAIELFATTLPQLQKWEQYELRQHLKACRAERYSKEQQVQNIEDVLSYKLSLKRAFKQRKDSLFRIHLKSRYTDICDQNHWDSAFVEECYWGKSPYMVVLLPQVHEVNNTLEEMKIVKPVQENIFSIQKKLYKKGATTYLYEGIPFKEISRSLPTKIPLDTIAKYFSKNAEIKFETNHPEILSYGIEDKSIHYKADSIRSYYWALETYMKTHKVSFPYNQSMFQESMRKHVDSCLDVNDVNLKRLNRERLYTILEKKLGRHQTISLKTFEELKDRIFNEMLEVMLNERNRTFVRNVENLQKLTGERFMVMKAGTSHFEEVDLLKEYEGFYLETIQEILREKEISYVYLVPYYVWHYNL